MFFASSLIGQRPKLQSVKAFGTDGEKALTHFLVVSAVSSLNCSANGK